jgi:hypothetical protein
MGQNNDNTEHGDLQGNQGGNLSKDPKEHGRLRQPEEGFARVPDQDALRSTRTTKPGETPK